VTHKNSYGYRFIISIYLPSQQGASAAKCGTKLQGEWRESSCSFKIPFQAKSQAPVEPGMQTTSVLLAKPANARD
jgi:hypothetical protein